MLVGCFGLFWCSFVFFANGVLVWNLIRQLQASSYPSVPGTILSSEVKVHHDSEGTSYRPEVRYRYAVDGQTFEGEQIRYDEISMGKRHAQSIVDRYPAGQAVTVYYHPAAPGNAVLELGLDTSGIAGMLFLTPFNAVAAAIIIGAAAWRRSLRLGRPVLGISVRDDGLTQTARIYEFSPVLAAVVAWGGSGFLGIFACLGLAMVVSLEAALAICSAVVLGVTWIVWRKARRNYTELRRDPLHGRVEVRTPDGRAIVIPSEDLQPLRYVQEETTDSEGDRVQKYRLAIPYFDAATQTEKSIPLPEQSTEADAKRFATWLNGVLGVEKRSGYS
jgi:hypothetical protein